MELRICGTEKELAAFIMYLGKSDVITPSVQMEIKKEKLVSKLVTTKDVADKYNLSGQCIRNYAKAGMPHVEKDNKLYYDMDEIDEWITNYHKKHSSKTRGRLYVKHKKVTVDLSDYTMWVRELNEMCRAKGVEKGVALSKSYKILTQRYGIVWDQLKKEYYNDNQTKARSTLELAYYLEQKNHSCKNLLKGVLSNVLEGKY